MSQIELKPINLNSNVQSMHQNGNNTNTIQAFSGGRYVIVQQQMSNSPQSISIQRINNDLIIHLEDNSQAIISNYYNYVDQQLVAYIDGKYYLYDISPNGASLSINQLPLSSEPIHIVSNEVATELTDVVHIVAQEIPASMSQVAGSAGGAWAGLTICIW